MRLDDLQYKDNYTKLWQQGQTYKQIAEQLKISFNKTITLRLAYQLPPRMWSRYRIAGKQLNPITDEDFKDIMQNGSFLKPIYKAYAVGLYYTAVRREELRKTRREQFKITNTDIIFSVGKRLKHGIETPPLKIPKPALFTNYLIDAIENTKPGEKVFPFSGKTCYNLMRRAGFHYCHFCRLSRITNFFLEGWTIPQVHSWTGLSLRALNFYLGLVDIDKMGKSLIAKQ